MRSFLIRSLRYLNGRTLSPFPTEAGQNCVTNQQHTTSAHLDFKPSRNLTAYRNNVEPSLADGGFSFTQVLWVIAERENDCLWCQHGLHMGCNPVDPQLLGLSPFEKWETTLR